MKIKLITRYAGPSGNYSAGSVLEFADNEAKQLINGGYAICLEKPKEIKIIEPEVIKEEPKAIEKKPTKKAVSK